MLPNYLVIGAARSGTTWLAKNLMLHPEVFMHQRKELHFFDRNYDKGIKWYEEQFLDADLAVLGEGTPAYLYHEQIPELVKEHLPNVKLIASLRDPVDRAYSHYMHRERERQNQGQDLTFEQKIQMTPRLIEEGLYARSLQRYYDLFPKENILVVLYDELQNNPQNYLRRVYEFLGVDVEYTSPLTNREINSSASKMGKSAILFKLYRALVRAGLFNLADSVNTFNQKSALPTIQLNTRKNLLNDYYLEDITKLENLIGQDLSSWKEVAPS